MSDNLIKLLKLLSFEEIEAADDGGERDVAMPEWGGAVRIRPLTQAEVLQARRRATRRGPQGETTDDGLFTQAVVCAALVAPKINAVQYQALLKKRAGVVTRLVNAILDASGLTAEALQEARDAFRDEPDA